MDAPSPNLDRHHVVDALRGLAIFGILVVNLPLFASPIYLQMTGEVWFPAPHERLVAQGVIALFQGKFITLFAMLFGFGMALQGERMDRRGKALWPIYLRRQGLLLVIGLIHALIFWYGDILVVYAVVGALMLVARRFWTWVLLTAALLCALVPAALVTLNIVLASLFEPAREMIEVQYAEMRTRFMELIAVARETYINGSWGEILGYNYEQWATVMGSVIFFVWMVLSSFMVGLVAGRVGVLQRSEEWTPRLVRWLWLTLPLGILGSIFLLIQHRSGDPMTMGLPMLLGVVASGVLVPMLTISYVTFFLVAWHGRLQGTLELLAPVGRMALTNYLMHTLVCTTLFNGYGLGLYGRVGPTLSLLMAFAIFVAQIALSNWWLGRYRFGPVEWLWRTATYGRLQPFRS